MSTTSMAIFSNQLFATYSVYARNASNVFRFECDIGSEHLENAVKMERKRKREREREREVIPVNQPMVLVSSSPPRIQLISRHTEGQIRKAVSCLVFS